MDTPNILKSTDEWIFYDIADVINKTVTFSIMDESDLYEIPVVHYTPCLNQPETAGEEPYVQRKTKSTSDSGYSGRSDNDHDNDDDDDDNNTSVVSVKSYNSRRSLEYDVTPCSDTHLSHSVLNKPNSPEKYDYPDNQTEHDGNVELPLTNKSQNHRGQCKEADVTFTCCGVTMETESTDGECCAVPVSPKSWFGRVYILVIVMFSSMTIVFSIVVLLGVMWEKEIISQNSPNISLPCEALTEFFPVASLYQYTDEITNKRFEDAQITRVKDAGKNVVNCNVSLTSILGQMSRAEYDVVEGRVKLQSDDNGPSLPYSYSNLTISHAELRGVRHDPVSIIINEEGEYFIYLSIELVYGGQNRCNRLYRKTHFSHVLFKGELNPNPRILLGTEHACCLHCDTESHTDFTGGLFHLQKNDRLFTQVSSPQNVGRSGSNYLGVIRMATE